MKRLLLFLLALIVLPTVSFSQTLIMNEVSQGITGNMEYVEFVVVDNTAIYDCVSGQPPTIDIRGWIFDDNSGYHGAGGIAGGCIRFSFDPLWSAVPMGTIILIYNDAIPNPSIPAADISLGDGNCSVVAPISNVNLFESNSTTPGAVACSYPAVGWTPGGSWSNVLLANTGDCARIVNLAGCEVFSVCYSSCNTNTLIYFANGAEGGADHRNTVYFFTDGDPNAQINWSIGCTDNELVLDANQCGANEQTPGAPNNALNAAFIAQFNNGCSPIPPLVANAMLDNNEICGCDGEATASGSGSIPGYTYEWLDNLFVPIGQVTATASGLCNGTYNVIVTSSIGCSDTTTITVNSGTPLQYTATITNENCGAGDGQIVLTAINGDGGPYQYSITGGAPYFLSGTFSGLSAGSFNISILDNSGCEITGIESMSSTGGPSITNMAVNNPTCAGFCNGSIVATVSGGVLPYTFQWFDAIMTPIGTNSATISGLCAGNYFLEVTDASGATVIVYSENFQTGGPGWTLNVPTGPTSATPNVWEVNDTEGGVAPPGCGVAGNGDQTLHITCTSLFCGSFITGALYNATQTSNVRAESPVFSTVGSSGLSLTFDYIGNGNALLDNASLYYNAGSGWTLLNPSLKTLVCGGGQGQWTAFSVTLPAICDNNPTVQIGFNWTNNADNIGTDPSIAINNIVVSTPGATCPAYANASLVDPPVVTISGSGQICVGATVALSGSGTPNGATPWVSANPAIATVSNVGLVTGVSAGTVNITYMNSSGCSAVMAVTVNALPTISGNAPICVGATLQLTGSASPAVANPWMSSNPGVVSVSGSGLLTGISAGSSTITYTNTNGCQITAVVTVNALPTISGNTPICEGATVQLTGSATPAVVNPWVSSNPAVASVINTGLVTGISAGSSTITYTNTNGCQITAVVTVNALPVINTSQSPLSGCVTNDGIIAVSAAVALTGTVTWTGPSSGSAVGVTLPYNITGLAAGTYDVTFTDETTGCVSNISQQILVSPGGPTISGNAPICVGAIVQLTGSGTAAAVNPWVSTNPVVATVSNTGLVTGISGGTATITYTDNGGCQNSVLVTIYALPTITGNVPICIGATVQLTGSTTPAVVNPWVSSNPAVATISNTGLVTGVSAGTSTITYTNDLGCQVTQLVTINANPTISGNTPICIGSTLQLTGSGTAASLNPWVSSNPSVATISNTGLVSAVSAGTTTITYTDNAGCQSTQLVTVNPEPTISGNAPICIGETVQLTGSGTAAIVTPWISSNPAVATVSNTGLVTSVSAGTTTITYTNSGGCQNTQFVTVNPTPVISSSQTPLTGCSSNDGIIMVTIAGGANGTVSWSGTAAGSAISVSLPYNITGLSAGTYDVTFTNGTTGCTSTSVQEIFTNPGAPDVFDLADQTVCDVYELPSISGNGLTGNESYWTGSSGTGVQIAAGTSITVTTLLYIYDSNASCQDEENVLITIVPSPVLDPISDVVTCDTYTLTAITGLNLINPIYYDGPQPGANVISGTVTTSQTVYIYDANGNCSDEISFQVTILPDPQVTLIKGGGTYCQGDVVGDILVDLTGTASWTLNYTIDGVAQTITNATSPISLGNQEGVYVLVDLSDANCATAVSGTQTILVNPILGSPIAGTDATYCENELVNAITATGSGGTFTWYNDPALTTLIGIGSSFQPSSTIGTTIYYVTETLNGCEGPASMVMITLENCEIIVPTAFTPDGDEMNDFWEIVDLDKVYPNNVVTIYNRWGNVLYESEKGSYSSKPWSGKYREEAMPVGSYYFIIDFGVKELEPLKGVVSIILN